MFLKILLEHFKKSSGRIFKIFPTFFSTHIDRLFLTDFILFLSSRRQTFLVFRHQDEIGQAK